jgi:hypothetical protein
MYTDPIIQKYVDLIKANTGAIKTVYQGEPIRVPASNLPCMFIARRETRVGPHTNVEDAHAMALLMTVITDVRQDLFTEEDNTPISQMDQRPGDLLGLFIEELQRLAQQEQGSFCFHPLHPSAVGSTCQRKMLADLPNLACQTGCTPIHLGNPGNNQIVAGIVWMVQHWDLVIDKLKAVWEIFNSLVHAFAPFIPGGFVLEGLVSGIDYMIENWDRVIETVQRVIEKFQTLIDMSKKVMQATMNPIGAITSFAGSAVKAEVNYLSNILPKFEMGGMVPGPAGAAVPIIAHGQERIIPAGQGSGGNTIVVNFNNPSVRSDDDLRAMEMLIERYFRQLSQNYKY